MSSKLFKHNDKDKVKTTNLLIIDASGSMSSKAEEVRGGIKEILKTIKEDAIRDKETVETRTIVIDFSSAPDIRVLIDEKDSVNINDTVSAQYAVRGMTALYDAIADGFAMVTTEKTFVTILTDGDENDSKRTKYDQIKELITAKKAVGWGITFMGTSEESLKKAEHMGMSRGNTYAFANNSVGTKAALGKSLKARASYHASNTAFFSSGAEAGELSRGIDLENLIADEDKNEKLVKEIKAIKKPNKTDK